MSAQSKHVIIVAGAGPAGMAAANMLAKAGHEVIILNRDIKFGGLAEYGIFPAKLKLRGGLKKQYWEMLEQPNVHYFGNVSIGKGKDLTVDDVRSLGASAVVFAIGAQGTKAIGVEGDSAQGVFHAKDVVYHFNRLPGFGDRPFDVGKHVAVIGAGDVMVGEAMVMPRPPVTAMPSTPARSTTSDASDTPPSLLRSVTFTPVRDGAEQVRPVSDTPPRVMSTQPPPVSSRSPAPAMLTWAPASGPMARLGVFTATSP